MYQFQMSHITKVKICIKILSFCIKILSFCIINLGDKLIIIIFYIIKMIDISYQTTKITPYVLKSLNDANRSGSDFLFRTYVQTKLVPLSTFSCSFVFGVSGLIWIKENNERNSRRRFIFHPLKY